MAVSRAVGRNAAMPGHPPFHYAVRRSKRAIVFVLASYGLTAALLVASPVPLAARAAGALAVAAAAARALSRIASRSAPTALGVGLDGRVAITRRDGSVADGRVLADTFVGGTLVTLVWQPDGTRWPRTLLLPGDSLDPDDFRRLRVALRYCRLEAPKAGTSGADDA
jgi:hypothetical protein